jgi:predicted RNA-binding protein with PUA-like domain
MAYWLIKSEPDAYSWAEMLRDGSTHWNGVRNHQAAGNLKAMRVGDHAFFYHSNIGKEIVGIVEIIRTAYPDPSDESGKFVMVDVGKPKALKKPVTLATIKAHPVLKTMALVKQSRLSVCPVTTDEHKIILTLGS